MKNLIIDGGYVLNRTYHRNKKRPMKNKSGVDIGHIYHFLNLILEVQTEFNADKLVVAWDIRDDDFINFRQSAVNYKGTRDRSERDILHKYDTVIWKMCELLGIECFKANKLEADDIVAWCCDEYLRHDDENIIVSADMDFIQLLNLYPNVKMYNMTHYKIIDSDNVTEFTKGVEANKHLLYKAIMGDSPDNIDGLFRYGPVKSAKFVLDFKENFQNLDQEDQQRVYRNIKIMDLREGLKTYPDERDFLREQIDDTKRNMKNFFTLSERLGITKITNFKSKWRRVFLPSDDKEDMSDVISDILNK
jgi:5'-3' exonuclease